MKSDLRLPLDKAVVGQAVGKLFTHLVTYVAEIERLEVVVAAGTEEYEYGHHLTLGHETCAVVAAFTGGDQRIFFQFRSKIFAELINNTEDFY